MKISLLLLIGCVLTSNAYASPLSGSIEEARRAYTACSVLSGGVAYAAEESSLCIKGQIDYSLQKTVQSYKENLDSKGFAVRYIVISGPGGELRPAIEISKIIESYKTSVVVGDICASSCAQFLFLSGDNKFILKGGVVAFHGGPVTEEQIKKLGLPQSAISSLEKQNKIFTDFYESRAISIDMLNNPPESVKQELSRGKSVMWSWPTEDLLRFGVMNVIEEK